jgi:beta-ureidopropionase
VRILMGCAAICLVLGMGAPLRAVPADRPNQPGRPVKVSAIDIGCGGDHEKKLKLALEHLEVAGKHRVDIACLSEEFSGTTAEPIPGPTTTTVGELAKKYSMYVICPIRELAADERQYNTAVLLDRQGKVVGRYRKVFPYWGEKGVSLGRDVPVFDTDFGRIAIFICFDINFGELWEEAEQKGAEIVFWPSAFGGGVPLNGYAMIHNYYIVSAGHGDVIDIMGKDVEPAERPLPKQCIATVDLDLTIVNMDFNRERVAKLVKEQKGKVELLPDVGAKEEWYLLRAVAPGVRVADVCRQYNIETQRAYRLRSREQLNELRKSDKPL